MSDRFESAVESAATYVSCIVVLCAWVLLNSIPRRPR